MSNSCTQLQIPLWDETGKTQSLDCGNRWSRDNSGVTVQRAVFRVGHVLLSSSYGVRCELVGFRDSLQTIRVNTILIGNMIRRGRSFVGTCDWTEPYLSTAIHYALVADTSRFAKDSRLNSNLHLKEDTLSPTRTTHARSFSKIKSCEIFVPRAI